MNFKIENGKNICGVGLSGIGSYFRFESPITLVWYDCNVSVGKYFCTLPYSPEYRKTVQQAIEENLNKDFSENTEALYHLLKPLLPIFKNGNYALNFFNNKEKEFFQYTSSLDDYAEVHYNPLEVVFASDTTDIRKIDMVVQEHQSFLNQNATTKKYYPSGILDHTTGRIYPGEDSFYATQSYEEINQERIAYFEERIKAGERPFAILVDAYFGAQDYGSLTFILDGHHKLLAYQNLDIYPPLAVLTYLPEHKSDLEFDAEALSKVLYPFQTEHLLKNWSGNDAYLEKVLQNPNSPLHAFIKNGEYEEYYDNGQLKHKAFYVNGQVKGDAKYWHENGQLEKEEYRKDGKRVGTWKDYFESGQVSFIQPFNDEGYYHGTMVSYRPDGQKWIEQQYVNGAHPDGISYRTWYPDGKKEAELTYENGRMIVRKNWRRTGELASHEVYNEQTGRLEKLK